ncbi:hypothetical protein [Actinophytocola glycyrrhizae]|uniref:Uncharacterized protein n=1 Tax=Actinophytocola glycyrrhizae TaxID=2044873 RepID=A0ABV9RVG4_9PSEU
MDHHHDLLTRAGRVPDGWLAIAREVLAAGDTERLGTLYDALDTGKTRTAPHVFAPAWIGYEEADTAVVTAVVAAAGAQACWATVRDAADRVYLVQAADDLPTITAAAQRALDGLVDTPLVEVFGPGDPLPAYHEHALLAATLLWSRTPAPPVRVARAFDGAGDDGPWFEPGHELVVDPAERKRLLDFLAAGDVVLTADAPLEDVFSGAATVPASLRSDGTWVWSDASRYYLDRHQLAPDTELVRHAVSGSPRARLDPLARHHVRAALTPYPADQEGTS